MRPFRALDGGARAHGIKGMSLTSVVIVGAGHAGVQAAASLARRGLRRRDRSSLRREGSALSAPAAVEGLSQGRDGHPWPAAQGRRAFPRAAHRLEARRQRHADRPRFAEGGAQRRRRDCLRPSDPRHRRAATPARRRRASICRASSRCATSPTRPRSASVLARSPGSSSSAPDSSGSKSPRPPRASAPRRRSSRSRARWAAPSRRSCRIFS